MTRKPLVVSVGVVGLLVGVYAAAGYLLAPSFIRHALIERARAAGFELRFGALATHPFALVVDGYDVQLAQGEQRLVYARRASVDVGWSSLWRRAMVLDHVAVEQPVIYALPAKTSKEESGSSQGANPPPVIVEQLDVSGARLSLDEVPRLEALELHAGDLSTREGHGNAFRGSASLASGGKARTQGTLSLAPLVLEGRLEVAGASLAEAWRYLPASAGKAPPGSLTGSLHYRYANGKLALSEASVHARLESGGTLAVRGGLGTAPFAADLHLDAQAVPLSLAGPLLAGRTALRIAGGTLSTQGELQLGDSPRYSGSASIRDAELDGPQARLLGWQRLETASLRLEFSPFALRAGEVVARAPHARVVIGPQGELNLARAFPSSGDAPGEPPPIAVERLRIEDARVDFADRSLETPFATGVRELSGAITGIRPGSEQAARLQLDGRVGSYGDARVRGTIDLQAPTTRTNVHVRFRNLALADFTPYAAKFAGYRIESGRLSAELNYRVRDGRLVGDNQLEFDKLKLGEKVQSASAFDLPVDLAVALLTDARGRIDLAIPVRGDLRDPQFDLGGLIAKALRNTLGRIVSAPFRMIASLLGHKGGGELDRVRFDPGAATLSPPAQENVAQVAKALAERPRLALSVRGGYDPQADREALQRAALAGELAKRAGYGAAAGGSAPAGIDAGDPKIVNAAERLFLSRGGQAIDLSALRPREPGYGRRLLEALSAKTGIGGEAAQALARERAQNVREALVRSGVDASRIAVQAPVEAQAGQDGVPTELGLHAG